MEITRTGIAALVALCGAAGAGGAYVANRTTAEPAAAALSSPGIAPAVGPDSIATAGEASMPLPAPSTAATPRPRPRSSPGRQPAAPLREADPPRPAVASAPQLPAVEARPSPADAAPSSTLTQHVDGPEVAGVPDAAPAPMFEELVVDRDAVLGLQLDSTVSSETARVEDEVAAHVTRDVRVGERVAIPAGTRVQGDVIQVERGGKLRERARIGVRFSSLVFPDGTRVPIVTDAIVREGDSPSRESAAKIGGSAIGGAILGGILGGGKGAIVGGTAGAGAGTAVVMAGGRNEAVLAAGTPLTVRLTREATITTER